MDQDTLNHGIRRFLKTVGVNTQREIEQAVAAAIAAGRLGRGDSLGVTMTLRIEALGVEHRFDDRIALD